MLKEAFRAITTLQKEPFAECDLAQRLLQKTGFTCENQRRKCPELFFDVLQSLSVGIIRHLHDGL